MDNITVQLDELRAECQSCGACVLGANRTKCVFGEGPPDAKLMFIGEAPGESEDLSGMPFVGAAGRLFDNYLGAVGLSRGEVYITNILKCRPPKNRDPLPAEEDACLPYLRSQVRLIRPRLIVCLGRIAAKRIIKPDFMITREHGVWHDRGDYSISAVYHPSALSRDPRRKEEMLIDFKKIKNRFDRV